MSEQSLELQARWLELEKTRLLSSVNLVRQPDCSEEQLRIEEELIGLGAPPQDFHRDKTQFDPLAELPDLDDSQKSRLTFTIVGAGISGLCMAARLRQAGFDNFEILEKAPELGGVWHFNKYPGLACDVPAQYYSFSFFRNPNFSHLFAPGKEIQGYLEAFAREFDLLPHIALSSPVRSAVRTGDKWVITTSDGKVRKSDYLILANGFLNTPKRPEIEGLETFAGTVMHSMEIPRDLDYSGLRVGNIGTGSTTVQLVANIVDKVEKLSVFQRTPQWMAPFPNEATSAQRRDLLSRYPALTAGLYNMFKERSLVGLGDAVVNPNSPVHAATAAACQANLDTVADPVLREKLTPDYAPMCKRLVYSTEFYRAIQKDNCELVTEAIVRVEPEGVRTDDGRLHEVDLLILATGFDITGYGKSYSVEANGRSLADAWSDGVRSLNSIAVAGFPNLFMLGGAHATVGNFSIMACAEEQSGQIIRLLGEAAARDLRTIMPSADAEAAFVGEMASNLDNTVWVRGGCRSWYLNKNGGVDFWTRSIGDFVERMRTKPDLAQFDID